MGFRRQDLQEAFFVPGTHAFRVWGYGTTDTLEEVLRPGYLRGGQSLVHLGELIYVSTRPRRDPADGRDVGETRAALVMVSGFERGDASLRLVQGFGRGTARGARRSTSRARSRRRCASAAGRPGAGRSRRRREGQAGIGAARSDAAHRPPLAVAARSIPY